MAQATQTHRVVFKVIDVLSAPYDGWILRLRMKEGEAPSLRELKGSKMEMRSAGGETLTVTVRDFPVFGGRPSDSRLARTGRIDVRVEPVDEAPETPLVAERWRLAGPVT